MVPAVHTLIALLVAAQAAAAGVPARTAGQTGPSVSAYQGAGAWVDIYSTRALARPEAVVAKLAAERVPTLYLETANHRQRRGVDIVHPGQTERFIDAAHARGIKVIAWYLPSFKDLDSDFRRSMAAIEFETARGERFDGFALDIESGEVASVERRNARLLELSRDLRTAVGRNYALGAIVPDDRSTAPSRSLWPRFPYRSVAQIYDVFLPMAYSTFRVKGPRAVRTYIRDNVTRIRARTGRPRVPVHIIAGLADGLSPAEAGAVADGATAARAWGASFYHFGLSGPEEWAALKRLR